MNETLRMVEGRPVLRIERQIQHPVEKVWRAITEPEQLSQWYPFPVSEMDLKVGGKILFDFGDDTTMTATVVELDPPRVFAFSEHAPPEMTRESDDLIRIELQPDNDGCLLIFTQTFDDRPAAGAYATGWNACLSALELSLAGEPVEIHVDFATEHERYIEMFGLDQGTTEVDEDGWSVRFERQLVSPVEDIWSELMGSEPTGHTPEVGNHPPAAATNSIISAGDIVEISAPTLLEYEWLNGNQAAGRVRWELSQGTGHGARLILTQTGPSDRIDAREQARDAWRARIEELARFLAAGHRPTG